MQERKYHNGCHDGDSRCFPVFGSDAAAASQPAEISGALLMRKLIVEKGR